MVTYTRQTPSAVREWLNSHTHDFPANWNLNQVAEESNRRWRAGRWNGIEANRSVCAWAMQKLAHAKDFSAAHWEWIAALDRYQREDGYSRISWIIAPAIGDSEYWRHSETKLSEDTEKLREAVNCILRAIESSRRLDVTLDDVVRFMPEAMPLIEHYRHLQSARLRELQGAAIKIRETGEGSIQQAMAESKTPYCLAPQLSDYLRSLQWMLSDVDEGAYVERVPLESHGEDWGEGLSEPERVNLGLRLGVGYLKQAPERNLRTGGEYGAYPARDSALRRAVIQQFPGAIFDRLTAEPNVTPASVIESACMAWFGNSPSQKEINAAIKEDRARHEEIKTHTARAMAIEERVLARIATGGVDGEALSQRLRTFLGTENLQRQTAPGDDQSSGDG